MVIKFDSYYIDKIQEKDAWKLCDFMIINQDRFKRYFPKTLEQNLTPTLSKLFAEKKVKKFNLKEEFLFTVKEKETDALVGLIYIKELDWTIKQGEFAYCIGYQFEGKSITSTAVKELSKYAFEVLGIETLQIIAHKDNTSSVKVALNNSFIWQKTLKEEFTPTGEKPLDMELYELYK
ncbi:GNAT family N-acetyltransferase [uncultured Lacinutrix sp.]|uniref:GNAT family N-acetyltransferase n=1 Tax=uncultured Lacinutrix sp. TaxID=574032 RepID=UPI002637C16C|nr:GNAT family N-acetyltransferase [uncultured Lacinutrix sp.]